MNSDIEKKQSFLFEQIIEKGYEAEKFQDFLISSKEGGDDLVNWSMPQLKAIVSQFAKQEDYLKIQHQAKVKQSNNQPNLKEPKSENISVGPLESQESAKGVQSKEKPKTKFEPLETEEMNFLKEDSFSEKSESRITASDMFYKSNKSDFFDIVQCEKLECNDFSINKIKAKILKCDKLEGGVFEKSYIAYTISTNEAHKVQRRFSDFTWLKQTLELLHTGSIVPPIAKKGKFRKYDDKHVVKRIYILQMFLDKLLSTDEFRVDPLVEAFLTMSDKKQFEKYKSQFKKQTPVGPEKVRNHIGEVTLKLNKESLSFNAEAKSYFTKIAPDVKKIYKDFKVSAGLLENVAEIFKGVSENCRRLNEKDTLFRGFCKIPAFEETFFSVLSHTAQKYSEALAEQAKVFRKQIYSIGKYETFYIQNIIEQFEKLKEVNHIFAKANNELTKKKEKLYEGSMSKWELKSTPSSKPGREDAFAIMLPKETSEVLKLRDNFALHNEKLNSEVERYMQESHTNLAKYLSEFYRVEAELSIKYALIWDKGLKKCDLIRS